MKCTLFILCAMHGDYLTVQVRYGGMQKRTISREQRTDRVSAAAYHLNSSSCRSNDNFDFIPKIKRLITRIRNEEM